MKVKLSPEGWAGLIEVAATNNVLDWRPYNAPIPRGTHSSGFDYLVGGEGWTLQATATGEGFPGGAGFNRIAERLASLAREHGLDDEFDFVTSLDTSLPPVLDTSAVGIADPTDVLSITAGVFPVTQDPAKIRGALGDYITVWGPQRSIRVRRYYGRYGPGAYMHYSDEQEISDSEWEALINVIEAGNLLEWLPDLSESPLINPLAVHYKLQLMGPGWWGRTVTVPVGEAGPLDELFRRMARLAEKRTAEPLPYFDEAFGIEQSY